MSELERLVSVLAACEHPAVLTQELRTTAGDPVRRCLQCGAISHTEAETGWKPWAPPVLVVLVCEAGSWLAPGPQSRPGRPWLDDTVDNRVPELHSGGWPYDIRVCISTENVVEVDKLYGPLVAQPVRVSIEGESWVVEREVEAEDPEPGTSTWVVCARFPLDGKIPGAAR
jgi:hypothetical protein